jgi:hypothetical protein
MEDDAHERHQREHESSSTELSSQQSKHLISFVVNWWGVSGFEPKSSYHDTY